MASILDRYGIKEVADVTFYKIDENGQPAEPVLYLDTLKMSSIEQTAETTEARGGKGNPVLISWDYGKEINVNIEDALFSPKSLAIMFGSGNVETTEKQLINRVSTVRATAVNLPNYFVADIPVGTTGKITSERKKVYMGSEATPSGMITYDDSKIKLIGVFDEEGKELKSGGSSAITTVELWKGATTVAGKKYFVKYQVSATKKSVTITGDSFPGTYYVTGDTYARSDVTGNDQFFQFIIPKAKMQAENTITLEAEGDPSVFNMSLKVMRPDDGNMMELVQYDLDGQDLTPGK